MALGGTEEAASRSVTFTATTDDLAAAYQRYYRARTWARSSLITLAVCLAILAGVLVVAMEGDLVWIACTLVAAAAAGLGLLLAIARWRVPVLARRIYRQQRALHAEVALTWTDEGLAVRSPTGESRMPWSHVVRWREDARVVLLYHSDALFNFVPTRVLGPDGRADLRARAARAGVPGLA